MKHGKRGNGNSIPSTFEHGPYYYGEGSTFLSDEISRRRFTPALSDGELMVLLLLNRQAWEKRNLIVRASASYLALQLRPVRNVDALPRDHKGKRKVPGERTVERHIKALIRLEYVRLHLQSKQQEGNWYFIEPVFIWSSKWGELTGIENAKCLKPGYGDHQNIWIERWYRQFGGTDADETEGTASLAVPNRQIGGTEDRGSGTRYRQFGGDYSSRSSDLDDAARQRCPDGSIVIPPNPPEGGKPEELIGVGPSADEISDQLEAKFLSSLTPAVANGWLAKRVQEMTAADTPIPEYCPHRAKARGAEVAQLIQLRLHGQISSEEYDAQLAAIDARFPAESRSAPKKPKTVVSIVESNSHAQLEL